MLYDDKCLLRDDFKGKKKSINKRGKAFLNHYGPLVTGSQRHKNILKQVAVSSEGFSVPTGCFTRIILDASPVELGLGLGNLYFMKIPLGLGIRGIHAFCPREHK